MTWSSSIHKKLDDLLLSGQKSKVAVFDADGTLWRGDVGDSFFEFQAKENLVPALKGIKDPWAHYRQLCAKDQGVAYNWLAQINVGIPEKSLQKQAHDFYWNHFNDKVAPIMRSLLKDLQAAEFEIWICTASHRWAIEPAIEDLNLSHDRLIAVEVVVEKGILTDRPITPVPYKSGKRFWLEKKLPAQPLLVAGNSMGDFEMLSMAKEMPLVVIFQPHLPDIKESEVALMSEAQARGWPVQIFS